KLVKVTENTIDDFNLLQKEIEKVREQGFATDNEEYEIGVRCVGAPVFNFMGNVIAGISISAPAERLSEEKMNTEVASMVKDIAKRLSIKFGFKG
ncbi:MAG: IclR family transcriptional regulator, partial [Deferribacterales bacterium]|nr:IclR family transcriptional regulator [Deferribacterales bacterium]